MRLFLIFLLGISSKFFAQDTIQAKHPADPPLIAAKVPFNTCINLGEISVKLIDIVDSRCPKGTQCIWAGEVTATVLVYKNETRVIERELTFNSTTKPKLYSTKSTSFKGYNVLPYPEVDTPVDIKDYVLTIIEEKVINDNHNR